MRMLNEQELRFLMDIKGKPIAIFLFTPLCGTCKVARRMLEVVEQLLPEDTLSTADVNMMPQVAQDYQIKSVPALMLMDADRSHPPRIRYRMGSVEELLDVIRSVP
ncbi:thioredoxin family protein [Paenibacillus glacialis]|uniref:Thiol reductase thioredoxin n=1 Tax=Paenibacillus glacialis TaxID=494026 RepID=A0A168MD59_9BACL|nr:thioredoxin family protein [Paenibacillus glacialis]OAB44532.1 thiol reductase thioredoxin [Paenibacillus glacialis]